MSIIGYIVKGGLIGCFVGIAVDSGNTLVKLYRLHKQKTEAIDCRKPVKLCPISPNSVRGNRSEPALAQNLRVIGLSLKYVLFGATLGGLYGILITCE